MIPGDGEDFRDMALYEEVQVDGKNGAIESSRTGNSLER